MPKSWVNSWIRYKVLFVKAYVPSFLNFIFLYVFQEFTEYTNFDECLAYIEDYMVEHGPFDGLLGFSQVQ